MEQLQLPFLNAKLVVGARTYQILQSFPGGQYHLTHQGCRDKNYSDNSAEHCAINFLYLNPHLESVVSFIDY